ncbi:MAG: CDP-diacylglycerol diphosphatase [Rhodospirillales bacterium]|nr:CDP-diacylglycerol diphosphatase [Rhodospirillales bacterium]MDE2574812.1 CDP-diacylglycerol diphosphatase [Rhodospirillales bacterium]
MRRFFAVLATILPALALAAAIGPARADPDALWKLVHGRCVPNEMAHQLPAPCAYVDLTHGVGPGYVVLKDNSPRKPTQFLVLPTARITGIEDPALLAPGAGAYFAAAWRARGRIGAILHRAVPDDWVALAVNSPAGRSQNQLHIHVDCVRADVRAALRAQKAAVGPAWAPFPVTLAGEHYSARLLVTRDLAADDPFRLLARSGARMADATLAVIGAGPGRFYLLSDHIDLAHGDRASAEELLASGCPALR